jgi:DNA-binding NarL/FixJ family response regulator
LRLYRGDIWETLLTVAWGDQEAVIAEDDRPMAALIADTLGRDGWRTHVAEDGAVAVELARRVRPTLAVLDVNLPRLSGYEVCRLLREELPAETIVVFLSGNRTETYDRVAGLLLGADEYMTKPFAPDELLARVRGLVSRIDPDGARQARRLLTPRELEVLHLLAQGLKQAEIAARLVISPKTVGGHVEHILGKLGAHSRAEAVAVAYQQNLV